MQTKLLKNFKQKTCLVSTVYLINIIKNCETFLKHANQGICQTEYIDN